MPTATTKSVLDAALALTASDRVLIDSLNPPDPEVDLAILNLKLARQRLTDHDAGKEEAISFDEVFKTMETP